MSKEKEDPIPVIQVDHQIDIQGIVDFNGNLGEDGPWGEFDNPFDAVPFMAVNSGGGTVPVNGIPIFPAKSKVVFTMQPGLPEPSFVVESVRFNMIGPIDFSYSSPRGLWEEIIDLDKTRGALGAKAEFFLSQESYEDRIFDVFTSSALSYTSYNILYEIVFSFSLHGRRKYCSIDPLIKTSSANR